MDRSSNLVAVAAESIVVATVANHFFCTSLPSSGGGRVRSNFGNKFEMLQQLQEKW